MFNIFRKNKEVLTATEDDPIVSANFYVDVNNNVNIYLDWTSDDDTIPPVLAALLFNINNGLYADKIVNIIGEEIKTDNENKNFLMTILLEWKKLNDKLTQTNNHIINQPLVRPTSFNANVKIQE